MPYIDDGKFPLSIDGWDGDMRGEYWGWEGGDCGEVTTVLLLLLLLFEVLRMSASSICLRSTHAAKSSNVPSWLQMKNMMSWLRLFKSFV